MFASWTMSRLLTLSVLAASVAAYFVVTEPTEQTQWRNGQTNLISWSKGVLDDVDSFDLEMTRLSEDGLTYIASTIPGLKHSARSLNIHLQDVPPGDDYFLLFLNATHGTMYALSPRFEILAENDSGSSSSPTVSPDPTVPTVTISGSPEPTKQFATTFPAESGALRVLFDAGTGVGMGAVVLGCLLGAFWTLL